jgi:hypothetical protein
LRSRYPPYSAQRSISTSPSNQRGFSLTIAHSSLSGSRHTGGLHDVGEPSRYWRGLRACRFSEHPPVALAPWCRRPSRKLALHGLRNYADEPPTDGYAARDCHA